MNIYDEAIDILKNSKRVCVFTGAGISVESGIPPFRGKNGLWNKIDPYFIDINYFMNNSQKSWGLINKFFYKFLSDAKPNEAHKILARFEQKGIIKTIITQNIDCLHQVAGSKEVYEYHGTLGSVVCMDCRRIYTKNHISLDELPPKCPDCGGLIKPNFIFFGEAIPINAQRQAEIEIMQSDCFLVIGTTGEILPASLIPRYAKEYGAKIIEINTKETYYTHDITDCFLQGSASSVLKKLEKRLCY